MSRDDHQVSCDDHRASCDHHQGHCRTVPLRRRDREVKYSLPLGPDGAPPRAARRHLFNSDGFRHAPAGAASPLRSESARDDRLRPYRNFAARMIATGPRSQKPQLKRDFRLPHYRNDGRKQRGLAYPSRIFGALAPDCRHSARPADECVQKCPPPIATVPDGTA